MRLPGWAAGARPECYWTRSADRPGRGRRDRGLVDGAGTHAVLGHAPPRQRRGGDASGPEAVYAGAMLHLLKGQVAGGPPAPGPNSREPGLRFDSGSNSRAHDRRGWLGRAASGRRGAVESGVCEPASSCRRPRTRRARSSGFSWRWRWRRGRRRRAEGMRWLRYGFDTLPLYMPLTFLASGAHVRGGGPARLGGSGVQPVLTPVGQGRSGAAGKGEGGEGRVAGGYPRAARSAVSGPSR